MQLSIDLDQVAGAQAIVLIPHLRSLDCNWSCGWAKAGEWSVIGYFDLENYDGLTSVDASGPDIAACIKAVATEAATGFPHVVDGDYTMVVNEGGV